MTFRAARPGRERRGLVIAAAAVWLVLVGFGFDVLWSYSASPGISAAAPLSWPTESRIALSATEPTLLVVLHPHCPCSRATVRELALLMAHAVGRVAAHVLVARPDGVDESWSKTDIWRSAEAIPGVRVTSDDEDVEARRFRVETSGQTLLYGTDGRLLFSGGITPSRGHSGDNAGRATILDIIAERSTDRSTTPVFGCHLFNPVPQCAEGVGRCRS